VIDPGMDGARIYEKVAEKGLRLTHILLTHGHFDHSEGVKLLAEKTGAKVCIHRADAAMLEDPRINSANFYYRGDFSQYPRTSADVLLEDGDTVRVGEISFTVLHTPGHTPGSVCFSSEEYLFCGDTVFAYGYGRYDLWGGDREALAKSLFLLSQRETNEKLCPGHGNTASLDRVRDQIYQNARELSFS